MVVTTRSRLPQTHFVLYVSIYILQDSGQSLEGLPSSDRHCQPTLITAALPTAPFTIYNKYNSSHPGLNIQYGKQDFHGNICSKWPINDQWLLWLAVDPFCPKRQQGLKLFENWDDGRVWWKVLIESCVLKRKGIIIDWTRQGLG